MFLLKVRLTEPYSYIVHVNGDMVFEIRYPFYKIYHTNNTINKNQNNSYIFSYSLHLFLACVLAVFIKNNLNMYMKKIQYSSIMYLELITFSQALK